MPRTVSGGISPSYSANHARCYIIAGDFNFGMRADENNLLETYDWLDVWPELKPTQDGFTRDTTVNALLRSQYPDGLQV